MHIYFVISTINLLLIATYKTEQVSKVATIGNNTCFTMAHEILPFFFKYLDSESCLQTRPTPFLLNARVMNYKHS